MTFNLPDIYKNHYTTDLKGQLAYSTYRDIIYDFNQLAMKSVVEDQAEFNMGNGLGPISVCRIRRNLNNIKERSVNWPLSNAKKQQLIKEGRTPYNKETAPDGVKWFVYFLSDFVIRFRWEKWRCKVKNFPLYSFAPTRGDRGNKTLLKKFLAKHQDNIYLYPLVERKKK